jgi:signal transduction histidine kinase
MFSVTMIMAVIVAIGALDYLSGAHISLRPVYYVPITMTLAWFGWRAATWVSLTCVVVWWVSDSRAQSPTAMGSAAWWNAGIGFVTFLIVVGTLQLLLALYREMERRVAARTASLQAALAAQEKLREELIAVGDRERKAVGRELHDGLCQHLTATAMATQVLADRLAGQGLPVAENARAIVSLMQEGITQSRQLASGLLLDAVVPELLPGELRDLAGSVSQQHGVACRCAIEGRVDVIDGATAAQVLRITQEAVRNAVKHAKATRIDVTLSATEEALRLEITDNGVGLPPPEAREAGMGLEIMAHRAAAIGGTLRVENLTAGGVRVSCRVPVAPGPR